MIEFETMEEGEIRKGKVIYVLSEHSFDFLPLPNSDIGIEIGYLNMGIDSETMSVQCVWGLVPKEGWNNRTMKVPKASSGSVILIGKYEPGLSWKMDKDNSWTSFYDNQSGWYCIGDFNTTDRDKCIEFATNSIAVIANKKLKALWLKPEFI